MLKGIDPLLTPELLMHLCAMGHGEWVAVVDANFTADWLAKGKPVVRLPGHSLERVSQAVLSVFPLDTFVDDFAGRMEVVGDPGEILPVAAEVQDAINAAEGAERTMVSIERFAFYDVAKQAYAVIQTGERRFYGCFMLRKGVIGPED